MFAYNSCVCVCMCVCVRLVGYLDLLLSSCTAERRLAQPDNVDVFVLTVPDEIQCKPASLIAARCLGCWPFVTYIVCVCVCVCVGSLLPRVCVCVHARGLGRAGFICFIRH